MAITKRDNSTKGWEGSGIDQDPIGKDAFQANWDQKDTDNMYGRSWFQGNTKGLDKIDCSYGEEGESGSQLLKNARIGNRPLLGRGTPQSPEQTGFRKPRSGAF